MTNPTITGGHGYMFDCETVTGWSETESGLVATEASDGDIITIMGTCDNVADEYAYLYKDISANAISTTAFPFLLVRWKTSASSNGLQAEIEATYTAGSGGGTTSQVLGFSTTWTTTLITLTAGRTIEYIRLIANDNPDTIAAGTFYVYFDFVLIFNQTYTIPRVAPGGIHVRRKANWVDIPIPGRQTDVSQYLGDSNTEIELTGEYDTNASWYSTTTTPGELFYWLLHESDGSPWQWFTSNKYTGKVTIREFDDGQVSEGTSLGPWRLLLKEFRLKSPASELVAERYGLT